MIFIVNIVTATIDYWGLYNKMPGAVYHAIHFLTDYLFVVVFCGMLLHWYVIRVFYNDQIFSEISGWNCTKKQ